MKWQLGGDWPVGPAVIPNGTIFTGVAGTDGELIMSPNNPLPLPLNAVALDDDAALQMCMWYEETDSIGGWHQLHFAAGIDREAIMATARHKKRWPPSGPAAAACLRTRRRSNPRRAGTRI
jgi:hypothetical protein